MLDIFNKKYGRNVKITEEAPFDFADDIIKCTEVELKEVLVKKWIPVESNSKEMGIWV
ncbi:hypothetical protein [Clostridioides difficile]|uniref:hypothetical protein n=1 Tax=Clostridioides difficile TaxID=1496 RepID=UPI0012FFC679|nr:hypothetical protein [Clostridioides difficile]